MRLTWAPLLAIAALLAVAAPALAQSVGVASAVDPAAHGTPPSEKSRVLKLGDQVIHNEQIETDAKGLLQILLADGTSFTVGPNSKMSIDSFVYDPNAGTAKVAATLSKGVFRFIGGKASKSPDGVALSTPVGTVGIRGGIADVNLGGSTGTHIDMRFGDSVTLSRGGKQLGWVFQNGYSIVVGPNNQVSIEKTPPAWTAAVQSYLAGPSGKHGGASGSPSPTTLVATTTGTTNPPPSGPNGPGGTQPPGTWSNEGVRLSTWEEIDNSSLAGVNANYAGIAAATITSGESTYDRTGTFNLDYSFSGHQGDMQLYIDDRALYACVTADEPTGIAAFSGDIHGGASGSLVGAFISQGSKTASGVVGGFRAGTGGWSADGAFLGSYTGGFVPH